MIVATRGQLHATCAAPTHKRGRILEACDQHARSKEANEADRLAVEKGDEALSFLTDLTTASELGFSGSFRPGAHCAWRVCVAASYCCALPRGQYEEEHVAYTAPVARRTAM